MPQIGARRGPKWMQVGAADGGGALLRGRDRVARTLHKGPSNPNRELTAMSTALAQNHLSRPGAREDTKDLGARLPIAPEVKARVRIVVVDDEHTLRASSAAGRGHDGNDGAVCGRAHE